MSSTGIRLSEDEIIELTTKKQPSKQINVLHSLGFFRASLDPSGKVLLERPHFEAVAAGIKHKESARPKVIPIEVSA